MEIERRYDIDWLRVIAIFLLIIYHIAIEFQPWGIFIQFIQYEETSETLWIPMALINIWRIPLLFFVSGMGVCFAMRKRDWKQLLSDRALRILVPLIFGSFFIVPIHVYIFQHYYELPLSYSPGVGHLWFLVNILIYISQTIGFAFLDQKYEYKFYTFVRKVLKQPFAVYLFVIPFVLEAILLDPEFYSLYVGSGHGFVLGMLAFFFGFQFVAIGKTFWESVEKIKYVSLIIAFGLYLVRLLYFDLSAPNFLTAIESISWIFTLFGFGYRFLNKPSKVLSYLSESVYPVYIVHMIFLYLGTYLILPLDLGVGVSFTLIVVFTIVTCFITFEILRRFSIVRPLFGMLYKRKIH